MTRHESFDQEKTTPSPYNEAMSVLALLAATALSSPAEQSPRDAVRVTALEGGRIGLQQGNLRSTLNVAASINGCTGQVYDGWSGDKYGLGFGLRVIDQVKKGNYWLSR
ncbi:hypothetical protein GCM10017783_21750 [Deinococcus piscis]|uniref:Uncharacterized protein n=2 Tax=Deinococcus piscis TaxID=394230 RepID=A0ABQ3K900_9DEIO|nr:hypothetical protein GCM10017783_21750 [Deinococcus piscis]